MVNSDLILLHSRKAISKWYLDCPNQYKHAWQNYLRTI